ncbi:serine hydrolase domain-containing protein [Nocardia sp. NPDC050435]|uniref:serine hydrolase domain-containing protein n=1 Tax=Nocardia sp. NPDC050435 TaxID=3155040 RepID=UPI0033FD7D6D
MLRLPRRSLGVFAILTVLALAVAGCGETPRTLDTAAVRQSLARLRSDTAVWALARVQDGERSWDFTSGTAELGTETPVPADGHFRIGSITKTFVATVILQLVAEGTLRLDEPVADRVPRYAPVTAGVTLRHLLDNTSGLHDVVRTLPMPGQPEFFQIRWKSWSPSELLDRALGYPVSFAPGSAYEYSTTNYLLLGEVIQEVTGHSYAREITDRIIAPLRLSHTSLPGQNTTIPEPHPHGYVPAEHGLLDYTEMNPALFGAGGEMLSTTADLTTFFAALLSGRLLPDALLARMKTAGVPGSSYGLGLRHRSTSCGLDAFGNDGDALTHQSWSFTAGARQVTLALGPNFTGDPDDAVDAFLDAALCAI